MLLRTRDKKWLKRMGVYLSFIILMSASLFYVKMLPNLHWTLIVPWSLVAIFFIAWRWTARRKTEKMEGRPSGRRRIKRYT